MYSYFLLSAADVVRLPEPAQAAYLACAWGVSYLGVVAVYQIVATVITIVLVDDSVRAQTYKEMGPPEPPLAVIVGEAMPGLVAVLVLRHVTSHLCPSHIRDAAAHCE